MLVPKKNFNSVSRWFNYNAGSQTSGALYREGCNEQLTPRSLLLQSRVLLCAMISFLPLASADAPFLARIGGTSLLESHGHSAPIEIMQAYVNKSFTEELV